MRLGITIWMGVPPEADADPEFDILAVWLLIDSDVPLSSSRFLLAPNAPLLAARPVCMHAAAGITFAFAGSCSTFFPLCDVRNPWK